MTAESEQGSMRRYLARALYWAAWSILGLAAYGIYLDATTAGYRTGNNFLKQEVHKLDVRIREIRSLEKHRAALLERVAIIEQLNLPRGEVLKLLNVLSASDETVSISSLEYVDGRLTLTGQVWDVASLPEFVVMLDSYGYGFDGEDDDYEVSNQSFQLTVRRREYRDDS